MDYNLIKWLHISSSMLLFGTGFGTAFFKFTADLSGNVPAIAETNRRVVLADWLFTTPTVIVQPLTGYLLAHLAGFSPTAPWLVVTLALYLVAGGCWLPVVWLQIRMRDDSAAAVAVGLPLPERYFRDAKAWFWLGIPAFLAMSGVLYLMVAKPSF